MERIGKRVIAVLAAIALAFSAFSVDFVTVEVKADEANAPVSVVTVSEADNDVLKKAALWNLYCQEQGVGSPNDDTWDARYDVIKAYLRTKGIMNGDDFDDSKMDWGEVDRCHFGTVNIEADLASNSDQSRAFVTDHLTVASGGALILNEEWKRVVVYEDAVLSGNITITKNSDNAGSFVLCEGATLDMDQAGRITTDNGGYILAEPHTTIRVNGTPIVVETIEFAGTQDVPYRLGYNNGEWSVTSIFISEVTLPADRGAFDTYLDYYYDDKGGIDHKEYENDDHNNRIELPPHFDKITISEDTVTLENGLRIDNLIVNTGATLVVNDGFDQNNKWSCSLDVDNATVNGTIQICNSNCDRTDPNRDPSNWYDPNRIVIYNSLTIGTNGSITRGETSDPEPGLLEFNMNAPVVICIPSLDKIALTDGTFYLRKDSTLKVNDSAHSATTEDGDAVTFDGHQEFGCDVKIGDQGTWIFSAEEHIVKEVVLPAGARNYEFTKNEYHGLPEDEKDHDGEGRTLAPKFEKVTVKVDPDKDPDWKFDQWLRIDNLVTEAGTKVTLDVTVDEHDHFYVPDGHGHHVEATDSQGNIIERYSSCSGDMYVTNATINGNLTIKDSQVHNHRYNEPGTDDYDSSKPKFELLEIEKWPQINSLEIGSKLTIPQGGSIAKEGNGEFRFSKNDGEGQTGVIVDVVSLDQMKELGGFVLPANATLKVGGQIYSTTVDGKTVTFNGNQKEEFRFKYVNNAWKITSALIKNPVLPEDEEQFQYTIDWYYRDDNAYVEYDEWGGELPPAFDTITIDGTFELKNSVFANKLIVTANSSLTFATNTGDTHEFKWEYEDEDGNPVEKLVTENGQPVIVTDTWAARIAVDDAEIEGQVLLDNSTAKWYGYDVKNDKIESGPDVKSLRINKSLKITGSGSIETVGNGELTFGEYDETNPQTIVVPVTSAIKSDRFVINPYTKVSVNDEYFVLNNVKSGNPGDEAVHDGFVLDGSLGNWAVLASQDDGSWALWKDEDGNPYEIWWGGAFENEYRVTSDLEGVTYKVVGGNAFTDLDFMPFTNGQQIKFEIIPPASYTGTGTPILMINGGIYYEGDNVYRSDDYLASDSWINGEVNKISLENNIVTFTPQSDEGIGVSVFYDPENIIDGALFNVDRKYLWAGKFDEAGKWYYYDPNAYNPRAGQTENGKEIEGYSRYGLDAAWADPANEFIVEVTQNNSNGTVEMTPGIDFYRLGNKVKAFYQGFEILGGNEVEIRFKPSSGYDLLALNIDGTSYSPSAVSGLSYSGGVYTLKITETPTKNSTLRGMYADDFKRDYVKIKTIAATFGIRYVSPDPDPTPVTPDPTPADPDTPTTPTTPVTPEPEPEVIKEPEVVDTINRVTKSEDGTETTTNITKYDDGSQTTEKIVEKPDGSSTATTTTKEADGTTVTEKVEKKLDGTEVITNTVKETDGSSTTEKVEKKADGTVTTTNTVKDADGATTTEKVVEKQDGSVTKTSTEKDADGNVLSSSKVVEKTKEDGTKTITATEKNADGSSSTSKTTLNTDGSSKISTTTQNADGSSSVSKTTIKADGSSKTNTETQNADGSTTTEKITEKADGSLSRTATTVDDDGNVLSKETEKVTVSKSGTTTGTTKVENADGSSSESVVKTKTDGSVSSTTTETDAKGNVSVTLGTTTAKGTETTKSFAVEEDGVSLTKLETEGTTATIPATIKANGETIPVTSVGDGAMKGNETVKTVKLADTITSIGEDAFSGAKNLKTIKLSANVTEIAPGAFDGIKSNATFYISAATDEEFDALVELLKKSGVGSKVKFKRA